MSDKNTVMIYACGGAGINIAKYLDKMRGNIEEGMSVIDIGYLDTSKSNLSGLDSEDVYLIENKDDSGKIKNGSGKVRAYNYPEIDERAPEILQKFKPKDLNIVISSGSGGSGSVLGPVIVSNLLQRSKAVVVIMVGGSDSLIELKNTINTIKSYQSIAMTRNAPVVCIYCENSSNTPRKAVDADVRASVGVLSAFFSGENSELDSADLYNWLNYTAVTSFLPKLVSLEFFSKDITMAKSTNIISVATLAKESNDTSINYPVEYQCVGYVTDEVAETLAINNTRHAIIIDGVFDQIHYRLSTAKQEREETISARVVKSSIVNDNDKPTATGLVF